MKTQAMPTVFGSDEHPSIALNLAPVRSIPSPGSLASGLVFTRVTFAGFWILTLCQLPQILW